jgi:hypothetical protein
VKQTGKAMPWQFNRFVGEQIAAHIKGVEFKCSDERCVEPNALVSDAKRWYCENVGYSNQTAVCRACWMSRHCTLSRCTLDRSEAPEAVKTVRISPTVSAAGRPKIPRAPRVTLVPPGVVYGVFSNKGG